MSVWVAGIGLAVAAVGSAVSAKGAADNAKAVGKANAANSNNEADLYLRQSDMLGSLIEKKENKLKNLGNIFERFNSTGAFGDTNTLNNLRKAQSDYSALAAGDFSGFEAQLRQSLSDSLIATAGSGAPIGTFAGLAAQDQMNLRGQGIQTAVGISEYLSKEANQLLGQEFGIMDQSFNTQYQLDRTKVTNVNNYALGKAGTVGVATQAYGQAAQQIGSSIASYGMNMQNQQTISNSNFNAMATAQGGIPRANIVNADGSVSQTSNYSTRPPVSSYGNNLVPNYSYANSPVTPLPFNPPPDSDPYGNGGLLPPVNNPYQPQQYSSMNWNDAWKYETGGSYRSSSSVLSNVGAGIAAR